jgi:hypothetical protein
MQFGYSYSYSSATYLYYYNLMNCLLRAALRDWFETTDKDLAQGKVELVVLPLSLSGATSAVWSFLSSSLELLVLATALSLFIMPISYWIDVDLVLSRLGLRNKIVS